jgi:ankyrin repeat protein
MRAWCLAIALGAAQLANGDELLPIEAQVKCYNDEFGKFYGLIPPEWLYLPRTALFTPPETDNPADRALLEGAFAGNLRAVDEAIRKGASATLTVDGKGSPIGNDSNAETAESKYERVRASIDTDPMARFRPGSHRMPQVAPRTAQFGTTFGLPPDPSSVLMWAVIGAKQQWCLQEALRMPPWSGLPAIKRLVLLGANAAFEDPQGRSPIAFAISSLDSTSPSNAQREELARFLVESRGKRIPEGTLTRWLALAATRGSRAIATLLIAKGADVSDDEALWRARLRGNEAMESLLISRGARLDMSDRPEVRQRLASLLFKGDKRALDFALENGADAALAAVLRERASQFVRGNVANPSVLRMLKQAGAQCAGGLSALFFVKNGIPPDIFNESAEILLEDLGCDANGDPTRKDTPLMLVEDTNVALVRRLVKHGGTIAREYPNIYPDTLGWAVGQKRPNLAAAVMEFQRPSPRQVAMLLDVAVRYASAKVVASLVFHGADPNAAHRYQGVTLLMEAVKRKKSDIARVLIEAGADINARTDEHPPFPWGTVILNPVTILGFHGDDRPDSHKLTALMMAAREGDEPSVRVLLNGGADKSIRSDGGATAEEFARARHPELADLIARYPN